MERWWGALWPSEYLPKDQNVYTKWWNAGIDPVKALVEQAHARGLELFFSHRASDRDGMRQHPEWVIRPGPAWAKYWNFAIQEVREFKAAVLLEAARQYDFDAIQLDFSRSAVMFPAGQQWLQRDKLTDYVRQVRLGLLEPDQPQYQLSMLKAIQSDTQEM